jgi:quinol monooxygenase YgiN
MMFVDMTFFEVESAYCDQFELAYGEITRNARQAKGCISSDLIRLSEINRYCWVERWEDRDAHQRYNEFLFGDIIPGLPDDMLYRVTRLENRDAEGVGVRIPAGDV